MRHWRHGGGFSVNAAVRIEAADRDGLKRLLLCCARPVFASERLNWRREGEQLSYALPKPLQWPLRRRSKTHLSSRRTALNSHFLPFV